MIDLPSAGGSQNGNPQVIKIQNDSNIDLSGDAPIDSMSSPNATPVTLNQVIVNGAAGASITAYFMNEDIYNTTPSDNGSGAASVTNTYGDGWAGNGYNRYASACSQGRGILCYGFVMSFVITIGSVQSGAGMATANPTHQTSNLVGAYQAPIGIPLNAGLNNTQFQDGTMKVVKKFYMSVLNQFSYVVPVLTTANFTALTRPQ